MARKTTKPLSWLTVLQNAKTVFIGEARVTGDVKVPATETSFRGGGYRITTKISPQKSLIGSPAGGPIELHGETGRAPEARLGVNSAYFPPDTLHKLDYWDYARPDVPQRVLVVLSEPAVIRVLADKEDDLPEAVVEIHSWLQLAAEKQKAAVLADLSKSAHNPVAYQAGFDLLMAQKPDGSALFESFNKLPGRPGAAIQSILERLNQVATGLSQAEAKALAGKLLDGWKTEKDPAALSSYLLWFDAQGQRTWKDDPMMRKAVLAEAERARTSSFSGANAAQWAQQVQRYASALISNSK